LTTISLLKESEIFILKGNFDSTTSKLYFPSGTLEKTNFPFLFETDFKSSINISILFIGLSPLLKIPSLLLSKNVFPFNLECTLSQINGISNLVVKSKYQSLSL